MDALQRAVPLPQHEVVVRRALGHQVLRQCLPLAASREHIEDRVQHLSNVDRSLATASSGWRNEPFDQCPFGVCQITRIAKAATGGSTAVFRFPNRALLDESSALKGITTDSSDSRSSWIGFQAFPGTSCKRCWVVTHGLMSVAVNRAAIINNTVIPVNTVA